MARRQYLEEVTNMQPSRLTGLNKRRQVKMAGKTMFIWVAIASVLVSFAAVTLQFLVNEWTFNSKVLAAKSTAVDTLSKNLQAVDGLKSNINLLVGNPDLSTSRNAPDENNLQVILDALPNKSDSTATATSLQQVIAARSGVGLESLAVPIADASTDSISGSQPVAMHYNLIVTGSYQSIQTFLQNIEKTIRPMSISSLLVTGNSTSLRATIDLVTYYQLDKTVTINKKAIH